MADVAALPNGTHRAIIAAPGWAGGRGQVLDLAKLSLERYRKNPVVLYEHGGDMRVGNRPVATTDKIERDVFGNLVAEFTMHTGDPEVEKIAKMWKNGQIRGASVGWDYMEDGTPELAEWSIVSIPWDPDSLRQASWPSGTIEENSMNKDEIAAMIKAAMADAGEKPMTASAIERMVETATAKVVTAAFAERDAAQTKADEAAKAEAAAKAAAQKSEVDMRMAASNRAALIVQSIDLLPDGFVPAEKSEREILLAAIGDRVQNAESRSDDYLRAALDFTAEKRTAASQALQGAPAPSADKVVPLDILSIRKMRAG